DAPCNGKCSGNIDLSRGGGVAKLDVSAYLDIVSCENDLVAFNTHGYIARGRAAKLNHTAVLDYREGGASYRAWFGFGLGFGHRSRLDRVRVRRIAVFFGYLNRLYAGFVIAIILVMVYCVKLGDFKRLLHLFHVPVAVWVGRLRQG